MSMMEKAALQMLQNMTGLTPDEMRAMIENTVRMVATVEQRMTDMEAKINWLVENTPRNVTVIEHGSESHAEKH